MISNFKIDIIMSSWLFYWFTDFHHIIDRIVIKRLSDRIIANQDKF